MTFDRKEMKFIPNPPVIENGGNSVDSEDRSLIFSSINSIADILRSQSLVGTAEYASPEMLNNSVTNYNTTDIWALGCIIFKFFHGKTPFNGTSEMNIFDNIINMRYVLSKDLPEVVKDLLDRMLVESPDKRLGSGKNGTEYDFASLKSHEFFKGINFHKLNYMPIPLKIDTFYSRHSITKSTGNLAALVDLKSLNSEIEDLSVNKVLHPLTTNLDLKKAISTRLNIEYDVSEFTYQVYSDWQDHNIIDDYLDKIDKQNNEDDIILIQEGEVKKLGFLVYLTTRKLKLFSNSKVEIWDIERNLIIVI
jgi:serine/threonine protein kinase